MSKRLTELLDRVCDTPGAVSSALSASEWHELRDLVAQTRTPETLRVAVHAIKETLYSGGSNVCLPADSFVETAVRRVLHGDGELVVGHFSSIFRR